MQFFRSGRRREIKGWNIPFAPTHDIPPGFALPIFSIAPCWALWLLRSCHFLRGTWFLPFHTREEKKKSKTASLSGHLHRHVVAAVKSTFALDRSCLSIFRPLMKHQRRTGASAVACQETANSKLDRPWPVNHPPLSAPHIPCLAAPSLESQQSRPFRKSGEGFRGSADLDFQPRASSLDSREPT